MSKYAGSSLIPLQSLQRRGQERTEASSVTLQLDSVRRGFWALHREVFKKVTAEQNSAASLKWGEGSWSFPGRGMNRRNVEHSKTWMQFGSTGQQDQNEEVAG